MNVEETTPLVFISYSHDSPTHRRWVAHLASRLVENGVEVLLDQWNLSPGADVSRFMEEAVRRTHRVLVICTEDYVRKANERHGGVGYESIMVTAELIRDLGSTRFIPLIRQRGGRAEVPATLSSRVYIDFSDDNQFDSRLEDLLRELHGVPAIRKPPLGRNPFGDNRAARAATAPRATASHASQASPADRLRIPKEHTDADRDAFLEDAYELMARSFEEWLAELQRTNSHVTFRFKRIDARQFSAVIYRHGNAASRCRIRLNVGGRGLGAGITYSSDDTDLGNSFNESLSANSNGETLFLRPLGLAHRAAAGHEGELTPEGGADFYWSMLTDPWRR